VYDYLSSTATTCHVNGSQDGTSYLDCSHPIFSAMTPPLIDPEARSE
jgi:hypothetical protein